MTFLEFQPHVYSPDHATFPTGGADGIALSPDARLPNEKARDGWPVDMLVADGFLQGR